MVQVCLMLTSSSLGCMHAPQVYERTAIETHLMRAASASMPMTDPLTNTPLASDQLLPVFPMRSRVRSFHGTMQECSVCCTLLHVLDACCFSDLRRGTLYHALMLHT